MSPLIPPAILAFTLCAWACARVAGVPAGRAAIPAAGIALAAATQILPGAAPALLLGRLGWAALFLAPLLGYAALIRALRRRARAAVDAPVTVAPPGVVRVDPDEALTAATRAACEGAGEPTLSLAWRAAPGTFTGHLRLRRHGATAEVELLHVDSASRGQGIATRLLAAAEVEARATGARRLARAAIAPPEPRLFLAAGFEPAATRDLGDGARYIWLEKELA